MKRPRLAAIWLRVLIKGWWYLPLIHWAIPRLVPLPRAKYKLHVPLIVRWLGHMLTGTGSALTCWSVWTLAHHGNGTPNPWEPPRMFVQHGPYCFCRNPMEQGNVLQLLGRALANGCPRLALTSLLFTAVTQWWIVRIEEPGLVQQFGTPYDSYRRRIPRWGWRVR